MKRLTLKAARKRKGLTQVELAAKVGKPQYFISRLENGRTEPRFSDVKALAAVLEIDPMCLRFDQREAIAS